MSKVNNKTPVSPCSSVSIVNFEQVNADWGEIHIFLEILGL